MKIYLLRSQIQIEDLLNYCEQQKKDSELKILDILDVVNSFKKYIDGKEIETLEREDMFRIR
jgi:hypothetical protein